MSDIFDPDHDIGEFNREWVTLSGGKRLCVWELSTADNLRIVEQCALPPGTPGGGISRGEAMIWQILQSCFDGDRPGARRIFREEDVLKVYRMKSRDTDMILDAIARVNGTDPERLEKIEAFTPVPAAAPTGT